MRIPTSGGPDVMQRVSGEKPRCTWSGLLVLALLLSQPALAPQRARAQAGAGGERQLVEGIAAIVGQEVILKGAVRLQVLISLQQQGVDPRTVTEAQFEALEAEALQVLIDETLIVARARRDTITVQRSEVEEQVNLRLQELRELTGGEAGLQQALAAEGLTELDFRKRLREQYENQLLQQKLIAGRPELNQRPTVSRREASAFVLDRGEELLFVLSRIRLIPPAEADPVQIALERIQEIRNGIVAGELDFADAARNSSQDPGSAREGGDLGTFQRGTMVEEFDNVVFSLPVGEISEPIRTQFGWHLIEVIERTGEEARARHILIRPNVEGSALAALSDRIAEVRSALEEGTPFAAAASRFSEDEDAAGRRGYWLTLSRTDSRSLERIPEEWLPEIQSMEADSWSGPLEAEDGVSFLFRMPINRETVDLVLQYDFQAIEQTVWQVRRSEAIQAWLAGLREETYIEIKKD